MKPAMDPYIVASAAEQTPVEPECTTNEIIAPCS